ncbi:related to Succinate dehydrogenase [ubiquinone] cytochrome b small subunit, mitochondrial [Saccharomycodes ludwigii]|uniref:Succinate dehydrogenase [ubiquinone] cytochrome b small subunit n=2 Tax=Saccharomycodes ludwigii TaxID=36035 RepID=A0A376B445_9ASCO|nr:related to Succinate dehydrogenase [ubiquinone] cytochrome b small subunit, mitochondrial [Saccharomycodes ludwigii]
MSIMYRRQLTSGTSSNISFKSRLSKIKLIPDFSKYKLISQPPGGVIGDVNEAYKPPKPDYFEGSYHWDYERLTAISLLPLTLFPFYCAFSSTTAMYPLLDTTLSTFLLIHVNFGLKSCIIDYIPKRKFGVWHTAAIRLLQLGSILALYGIYDLETNNNGIIDLLSQLWKDPETNLYIFGKSH